METSQTTTKLFGALAKFQDEVETIKKDASNPFFKSAYSPLETILPAIKEPLKKAGLIFTQIPQGESELCTIIAEVETGEYIKGTLKLTPVDSKPQSQGSAITYARRYMLVAMLGLNTDKDDDGNEASGKKVGKSEKNVDKFFSDMEVVKDNDIL